jgi:hypothetical protein
VTRLVTAVLLVATASVAASQAQQPPSLIQNGRVETRTGQSVDQEIKALTSPDPVWLVWRVPMVPGDRELCSSFYSDRNVYARGYMMEWAPSGTSGATGMPQVTPPKGPVQIEAGTSLLVLVRTIDGSVERLRTLADDCPIDAGGRAVNWLSAITPAESLRFLESLTRPDRLDQVGRFTAEARRNTADSAVTAISLHRDPAADTVLDRLAATTGDMRRQAAHALAATRGAHGLATVQKLTAAEKEPEMRRMLVGALGLTREAGTPDALRPYLRDADARVRAEAIYWFAQRGGAAVIGEVTKLVEAETDDNVRRRGVSGLSRLPVNDSIPALLQLARSSPNAVVRKEAVSALSRSKDPRAMALMEELIKRNQ